MEEHQWLHGHPFGHVDDGIHRPLGEGWAETQSRFHVHYSILITTHRRHEESSQCEKKFFAVQRYRHRESIQGHNITEQHTHIDRIDLLLFLLLLWFYAAQQFN